MKIKNLTELVHRKISHTMRNLAWCAKSFGCLKWFRMVCKISHSHAKMLVVGFFSSDFLPCISDWRSKGLWSAPKLGFFMYLSFNLHCHGFELLKTPKLAKNLLVTFIRFLNVPIELKGINYYSKVIKTVSFKL